MKCPTRTKKMKGKDVFFQNQRLHFTFCCSAMAAKATEGEATITIYGDNKKPFDQDFVADHKVMDKLFEYVLDRHPNFMPAETMRWSLILMMILLLPLSRKITKFPKLMFAVTRKIKLDLIISYFNPGLNYI